MAVLFELVNFAVQFFKIASFRLVVDMLAVGLDTAEEDTLMVVHGIAVDFEC